jgi:hypothetical protein
MPQPDKQVSGAHLCSLDIAFRPAEFLRADLIGFLQMFRAKRNVLDWMIVSVIPQANFHWIQLQEIRKLIERAFERVDARALAGRTHESGRGDVNWINRFLDPDRVARVHHPRGARAASFDKIPDRRRKRVGDMTHGLQLAVRGSGDGNRLAGWRAMTSTRKHRLSREMKLYRNACDFCCHGGEENMRPDRTLAAKRASNEWTDHANIFDF